MKQSKLVDYAQVSIGQGAPQKIDDFSTDGNPFIRAGSLETLTSGRSIDSLEFISDDSAKKNKLKLYPANSVVFAKSGMSATKDRVYKLTRPCYVVSHLAVLIPEKNTHPDYLRLVLQKHKPSSLIKDPSYPSINQRDIENFRLPFPSFGEQIRIAAVLTRAEKLIAKRKESIKALDELLKSTFVEMFGDPVRNEKGWETLPMYKVGKYVSGGTPSKERNDFWTGNFPWVSPKDMKVPYISSSQDYISSKVFEETSLKKIAPGHLLIVVRGMILAHSFPTAINTVQVSINQDMKAIQPIEKISVHYLKNCLDNMKRQILVIITTAGHGTKKLDTDSMKKVLIPVPPLFLQDQFAAIVEKVESLKSKYTNSLTELENLYGSLSQRAFKGELDLSGVPVEGLKITRTY